MYLFRLCWIDTRSFLGDRVHEKVRVVVAQNGYCPAMVREGRVIRHGAKGVTGAIVISGRVAKMRGRNRQASMPRPKREKWVVVPRSHHRPSLQVMHQTYLDMA